MTETEHALALAAYLDTPLEPDGAFVGLSDASLLVIALRFYATALAVEKTHASPLSSAE